MVMLTVQVDAAEEQGKAVILINPKLVDIPSSGGVMGVRCSLSCMFLGSQPRTTMSSSTLTDALLVC